MGSPNEIYLKILRFLDSQPPDEELSLKAITTACGLNEKVAIDHIEELIDRKLMTDHLSLDAPPHFSITREGRDFLTKNKPPEQPPPDKRPWFKKLLFPR